jgi:hypothetical protein
VPRQSKLGAAIVRGDLAAVVEMERSGELVEASMRARYDLGHARGVLAREAMRLGRAWS